MGNVVTREYGFTLKGKMPLLMHADDVDQSDKLAVWRKDPANKNRSQAGDDRSPVWTWRTYLYSDGEHICMPSDNIMVALRQAGSSMILKKQKTFKEISQSGLLITAEHCDFFTNGHQVLMAALTGHDDAAFTRQIEVAEANDFKLFCKRARVGTSKHIRVRPRFDDWEVRGRIQVLRPEITFDVLSQLFELAGHVGLCDWRPGCKTPGNFGMFSAVIQDR